MNDEQTVYLSYLLRLWSIRVDHETEWRASLEGSLTGERQGFASLDELLDFLRRETGQCADETRVKSDGVGDKAPQAGSKGRASTLSAHSQPARDRVAGAPRGRISGTTSSTS